jgi:alkylation response protein AidB-like acyl-CoA dehydrogenase
LTRRAHRQTIAEGETAMDTAEDRSESIRMIRDSAAAVAPREGDLRRIRALRFKSPGFDRQVWQQMCDLGWTGLRLPEASGGSALGASEFCALAEELGWALAPEPLIQTALAAALLPPDHAAELISGRRLVLPAWQERPNSLALHGDVTLNGDRLTGIKRFIPLAAGADAFLVTIEGAVALVAANAPGLTLQTEPTQDGGHFGTLTLADTPAEIFPADPIPALEEATLATAAYLLGVMDHAFAITLDYLKTRQQFGRPIGSFQSLQHRAADLKIQIALTRASVDSAAATIDSQAPAALKQAAVSRAKARASDAAMLVTRQAIQLHGGVGYADEHDIGLFLRRAMVLSNLHGSSALHRARFLALSPEQDDE